MQESIPIALPFNELMTAAERPCQVNPRLWLIPLLSTLALHIGAAGLVYLGWQPPAPVAPKASRSIKTQLVVMPAVAEAVVEPEAIVIPAAEPAVEPPAPETLTRAPDVPAPVQKPEAVAQQPDSAAIARKKREQQRERELEQQRLEHQHAVAAAEAEAARQIALRQAAERRTEQLRAAEAAAAAARAADISTYAPITKAAPDYPRRALSRRLEGDCTVEYTVLPSGRVSEPSIVPGGCEEQLFVRPSLSAAEEFVYQPRMVDGKAVAVSGVRNTFRYRIDQ